MPITIIESPVLHRPTVCSMSKSHPGTIETPPKRSASMITIPTAQAITQGCEATLRSVSFRFDSPLKIAIPLDHMVILTGIRYTLASISPMGP